MSNELRITNDWCCSNVHQGRSGGRSRESASDGVGVKKTGASPSSLPDMLFGCALVSFYSRAARTERG